MNTVVIKLIKRRIEENPAHIGEEARDDDLYSEMFPRKKTRKNSGMGLLAGGVASRHLAEAIAQLEETKQENKELWSMVDTLAANQTLMMARNERLEKQYEELKSMLLASQGHAPMNRSQVSNSPAKNQLEELDPMNCINQAPSLSSRNKKTLLQSQPSSKVTSLPQQKTEV